MKVTAKDKSNAEHVKAARVASIFLNQPHIRAQIDQELSDEMTRQLIYALSPSEGMPDIRPRYPRYEDFR